jgi:8-oxo-dGTP pyrophosphatase MutT (NUDIX family)
MLVDRGLWHILYTRRTVSLPEHSGQVAFPGGRADSDDETAVETALREAEEEINLKPQDVKILGQLNEILTISNYRVTPIVAKIPWPYSITLASEEVSRVFTIPLDWLAQPGHHEIQLRDLPKPFPSVPVVYFNRFDGELLWGVTAEITLTLLYTLNLIQVID